MADVGKDVASVILANGTRTINPAIVSAGSRSHTARCDGHGHALAASTAELFLVNSRLRRGDAEMALSVREYLTGTSASLMSLVGREARQGSIPVQLPPSVELRMSLTEAISKRRSVRHYSGAPLPLEHLATIVRASAGLTAEGAGDQRRGGASPGRAVPSGGGLYPIELHVAAFRVETLPRATYVYDPHRDVLEQTGDELVADGLLAALAVPGRIITESKASAVCLLVGRPWRSMRKYGDRGMRYVFLEAGAMAEHVSLAAAALGVGDVHCGSFYDDEVHEALGIDGVYEALIHAVFLGSPAQPMAQVQSPSGGESCPT